MRLIPACLGDVSFLWRKPLSPEGLETHKKCATTVAAYHSGMSWIGWALLSAFFAAATALLAKVGVEHVDSNLATAIRTTVVLLFAWGIALAMGKHGEIRLLDRRALLFLTL